MAFTRTSLGALRSTITALTRATVGVWHGQLGQQWEPAGVPWPCSPASRASSAQTTGLSATDAQAIATAATSATETFSQLTPSPVTAVALGCQRPYRAGRRMRARRVSSAARPLAIRSSNRRSRVPGGRELVSRTATAALCRSRSSLASGTSGARTSSLSLKAARRSTDPWRSASSRLSFPLVSAEVVRSPMAQTSTSIPCPS